MNHRCAEGAQRLAVSKIRSNNDTDFTNYNQYIWISGRNWFMVPDMFDFPSPAYEMIWIWYPFHRINNLEIEKNHKDLGGSFAKHSFNFSAHESHTCLLNVEVPSPFPLEGCRSDNTCVPPHSTLSGVDPIIASDVKTTVKTTLSSKLRSHFCWLPPQVYIFVYTLSFPQEASFIVWISAGVAQRRVVRSHTDKKNEQMLEQIKVMKNHMCPGRWLLRGWWDVG